MHIVHVDHEDLLHDGHINASMLLNAVSRTHAKDVFSNMHIGHISTSKMHIFANLCKKREDDTWLKSTMSSAH